MELVSFNASIASIESPRRKKKKTSNEGNLFGTSVSNGFVYEEEGSILY